jgi:phage terminase large subunit
MEPAKLTNVFHRTGEALIAALNGTGPRLIVNEGGQGSSKTISTIQVIYNCLKGSDHNLKTTFCSYALPHLKLGVIADFDNIILPSFGENVAAIKSNPAQPAYHINKSEINCYGVEGNIAMAHGPRRDILFINEINRKITYEVFDHLFSRSRITLVDYNPDCEFFLHEKVLPFIPHVKINSTFLDNPYLPAGEYNNILMKKDNPKFANWWRVYGLGLLGKFEGAIFQDWRYLRADEQWPDYLPYGFGLDFGFSDPDALVKTAIDTKAKKMYWDEKIYKSGNTFQDLKNLLTVYCPRSDQIIADCADARMIAQLRPFFNIKPVDKKKWTIPEALKMMQDYEHIITPESVNLSKEFSNYVWSDKKAGIPIDGFSHLIDGGRYRFMETITHPRSHQQWHG